MINRDRIPFSLNNERYNTYDFVTEFYKHKEIYFWIKIDDFSASYCIVRLLTLSSSNEDIFKITIDADCNVTFNCLGTKKVLGKIKPNEWSLIGLSLKKINDNETSLIYVLNDKVKNEADEINEELKDIKKITFGPNTNSTLENYIPYSILFAGIGIYDHDKVSYNNIYYDGKRFINNKNSKKASGVIYYNNKTYKDLNVIPLNGSLLSQKGIMPIEYSIASPSYLNKKSKIF